MIRNISSSGAIIIRQSFGATNISFPAFGRTTCSVITNLLVLYRQKYTRTYKPVMHTADPDLKTMKIESPQFRSIFTPDLEALVGLFKKYDYELRIAGGAVRDLLMCKEPHDIDFATTATPQEMKDMFEKENIRMINAKGEKHGTITCRINDNENFEVTTLRIDVVTDGRHAEVEFTRDWQLDAMRRDLTINSMFLGLDGTLYDYFRGKEDLEQRKVRFVGDAVARIQEDYLRILRYFRFYGRIAEEANSHEADTLKAIRDNMEGLKGISGERIWVEIKKIVTGRFVGPIMRVMLEQGMAPYLGFPDQCNIEEFERIWEQCRDLEPLPFTLLPALMTEEQQMYTLHERLKLSREELRLGLFIINHRQDDLSEQPFNYCQDLLCDVSGKEPKTKERIMELMKYLNQRDALQQFQEWQAPKFPVNGHKLLERGVPKGPMLAKVLAGLRGRWKDSRYTKAEEELLQEWDSVMKEIEGQS